MLRKFAAIADVANADLIAIYAEGEARQTIVCKISLDTLADIFERRKIDQAGGRLAVAAEIDKSRR